MLPRPIFMSDESGAGTTLRGLRSGEDYSPSALAERMRIERLVEPLCVDLRAALEDVLVDLWLDPGGGPSAAILVEALMPPRRIPGVVRAVLEDLRTPGIVARRGNSRRRVTTVRGPLPTANCQPPRPRRAPRARGGERAFGPRGRAPGCVYAFSGADDSVRYAVAGDAPFDVFGCRIGVTSDVDGDGAPHWIAAASSFRPGDRGYAVLCSGASGEPIQRFDGRRARASASWRGSGTSMATASETSP